MLTTQSNKKVAVARNRIRASHLFVRDIMSMDLFVFYEEDTLLVLKEMMEWKRIRHIPVISHDERLVGLVTHRDLLRHSISDLADISEEEKDDIYGKIKIGDIMNKEVKRVTPSTPLSEAASLMQDHKFGCLPVEENGRLIGIVTEADFVHLFVDAE